MEVLSKIRELLPLLENEKKNCVWIIGKNYTVPLAAIDGHIHYKSEHILLSEGDMTVVGIPIPSLK